MRKYLRSRNYVLIGGSLLAVLFLYFTDPDHGAITVTFLGQLATPIIAVWFTYLARKALFDYIDAREMYLEAKRTPVGAAIVFLGICLVMFGLLGLFGSNAHAQNVNTFIPDKAYVYLPTVKAEQVVLWKDHPKPF